MANFFLDDEISFDSDDPEFSDVHGHCDDLAVYNQFNSDICGRNESSKMSCGMIQSGNYTCHNSSPHWLERSESAETLDSRFDSLWTNAGTENESQNDRKEHHEDHFMTPEELRLQFNSCYTCGVSWADDHVSLDCAECGGYATSRPCPMCDGRCQSEWSRDNEMSHSIGKAHWEGECKLKEEDQSPVPAFLAEEVLIQGLEELSTS